MVAVAPFEASAPADAAHAQGGEAACGWRRRFRDFVLTSDRLTHAGRTIVLPPKPLGVLGVLAARQGEIVSKADLIASVWRGAAISDESIARSVFVLRRSLAEADPLAAEGVETVYGRGYRFGLETRVEFCPAAAAGPMARLVEARRALFEATSLSPFDPRLRTCLALVDALLREHPAEAAEEREREPSRALR